MENEISITPTTEAHPNNCQTSLCGVRCLSQANLKLGKLIGRDIFEGVLDNTTPVAIKQVSLEIGGNEKKMREEMKTAMMNKVNILDRLRKSNMIIPVIGYYYIELDTVVWIVMEYAKNGDLMNFARKGHLKGLWLLKAKICAEIAEALHEVHKLRIVHGDMKASNILIDLYLKTKLPCDCGTVVHRSTITELGAINAVRNGAADSHLFITINMFNALARRRHG
ncbi:kinase-like domain-containing protein [Jimgerdemannia flammicorona]|uniref:Kinase-like domain-containing protein n=1 Tax=Jimgerdemannia flammicorona TaxID=994334 RepID=A0A433DI59_9FUNG|nr:kinase-like domain-containing protein [Jimgerdemannia flammicorona]